MLVVVVGITRRTDVVGGQWCVVEWVVVLIFLCCVLFSPFALFARW